MNITLFDKNDIVSLEEKLDKILHLLADKNDVEKTEWLRSSDVKALLHVSDATLKNYRDSGKLHYSKIGGTYYYSTMEITNLLTNSKSNNNGPN